MSGAPEAAGDAASPKKGSKKMIIIIAAAVLLLGGGGAVFMMKKNSDKAKAEAAAAAEEDGEDGEPAEKAPAHAKDANKTPPTFLPLEPFVVNLTDREADRYAQVAVTLQIDDAKVADQLKAYLPAVRGNILSILTRKSSQELLSEEGKEKLKGEIMRESVRPLGIEIEPDEPPAEDEVTDKKKKKKKKPAVHNPVEQVHFSNFIIQ
jgi:flagellar FliL protein